MESVGALLPSLVESHLGTNPQTLILVGGWGDN